MISKILVITFYVYLIFSCEIYCQSKFDFSGINQFWILYAKLTNDEIPDNSDWSNLFDTPGYNELIRKEFSKEFFIKYYSYAFMPSYQKESEDELAKDNRRVQYLKHLISIKDKIELLKNYQKQLENDSMIIADAIEMTKKYLPKNVQNNLEPVPIAFVFFGNDARGYSSIIIDLLFAAENKELVRYFIAHEAHHFYRNKHLTFIIPDEPLKELTLLNTLNQLQAEGIADRIDKKNILFNEGIMAKSGFANMYKKHLANSISIISKFDSLLILISKEDTNQEEYIDNLNSVIPMSGHPTGYFIADIISEELGKNELIRDWGNPHSFFEKYNHAAKISKKGYPIISEDSINYIKKLLEKYSK